MPNLVNHLIDQRQRNAERLEAWRDRYERATGHRPTSVLAPIDYDILSRWPDARATARAQARDGNAHIVRMPCYAGQYQRRDNPPFSPELQGLVAVP
ncbi:MAG: hypothetical protein U5L11_02630 [Arhodomonas sp.]|nr:hypothetical protein [Arhodomonas sp.]